ncbi:hypothetical protein [Bacillus sp. FJAT-27245]|uniref:hypothetical protein n=1 Tax=Bacillus sp. FJAT-27245 TaxID=1684144 RepID=UPI0006A78039|nr:hypothetical protein [Bacillus sp. FJAT-27245]
MFIRKRLLFLYFAVAALLVVAMMVAGNPAFSKDREIRLEFADNFISYVIDDENGAVLNLFAVQEVREKNVNLEELVTSVRFANPSIEVVDFKVDAGMVHKGYKLVNFRVTARVVGDELERENKLKIWFGNGKTATYRFGELAVQNGSGFEKGHFVPTGSYTAAYPSAGLDVQLKNTSGQETAGLEIEDLSGEISHEFADGYKIRPGETGHIKVKGFGETEYDFTMITPIFTYSLAGEEYRYNMPGVLYGVMLSDQEKINRIIE